MVNILMVSHSKPLAKAAYDFVNEMKMKDFSFEWIGGIDDGKSFGTNPLEIATKLKEMLKQKNDIFSHFYL